MKSLIQPRLQFGFCRAQVAVGNAYGGEAEFASPLLDLCGQPR